MNRSFWKGVLAGVGGLFVLSVVVNFWSWLPWLLLLGGGGAYAYHKLVRKSSKQLSDPADKARKIVDEVEKRIEDIRTR